MTTELLPRPRGRIWRTTFVFAALLSASVLAGCAGRNTTPARIDSPAARTSDDPICPAAESRDVAPSDALIAYHAAIRQFAGVERLRADALAAPGEGALERMCRAIVLSAPGAAADLARAWVLLRSVLTAEDGDALAVRPLANLLAEEVRERMRLTRAIDRLQAQLKETEQGRAVLQKKLDALTEIERSLPARPSPDSTLPPPPTETVPQGDAQ